MNRYKIQKELTEVINQNSLENESGTPDFMIARYLMNCLEAYNECCKDRMDWYKNYEKGDLPPHKPPRHPKDNPKG